MAYKNHNPLGILWLIALVIYTPAVGLALNSNAFAARSILLLLTWTELLLIH